MMVKISTFRSKVSYGLLSFVFMAFFGPVLVDSLWNGAQPASWGIVLFLVPIFVLVVHMLVATVYTIRDGQLHIKCGFIAYRPIDLADVKSISASRSWLAAPAPSFDRLEIRYGRFDGILVSPKDKVGFAQAVARVNPEIIIQL